jgi:putative ABC transport system permease protein
MFQHIFKLIWKRKRSNFLLMLEIFLSFMVLFGVSGLLVFFMKNYQKTSGIDTENVWVAFTNFNRDTTPNIDLITQRLSANPNVISYSFSSFNAPYSDAMMSGDKHFNDQSVQGHHVFADANYPATMGLSVVEGRWFTPEDTLGKYNPVVITASLRQKVFGETSPIGRLSKPVEKPEDKQEIIIGVVEAYKNESDYQETDRTWFMPMRDYPHSVVNLKMKPGADAAVEYALIRDLCSINPEWAVDVQHLTEMKAAKNNSIMMPLIIASIVCGFLVINVALGLFGVLFQNIQRRRGEIGVRRAMGASRKEIMRQFVGETLMIALFGIALGVFFAVQFPLLQVFDVPAGIYIVAILSASILLMAIVAVCAWYPSRQAAAIFPAEALRDE